MPSSPHHAVGAAGRGDLQGTCSFKLVLEVAVLHCPFQHTHLGFHQQPQPPLHPGSSLSDLFAGLASTLPRLPDVLTEAFLHAEQGKGHPRLQPCPQPGEHRKDAASCSPITHSTHSGRVPTVRQAQSGEEDTGPNSGPLRIILCGGCFHLARRKPGNITTSVAFVVVVKPFTETDPFHFCERFHHALWALLP